MWLIFEVFELLLKIFLSYLVALYRWVIPPAKKDISGQVVLITGAGGGIGRQLALEFSKHDVSLVLWDINSDANEETVRLVRANGKQAHGYLCDITQPHAVNDVMEHVRRDVGDVDILVNNAGVISGRSLLSLTEEQVERTFKVNIIAQLWTTKACLPRMQIKGQGHIINLASVAGFNGVSNMTDYCASKFGVRGFTEALRDELDQQGYSNIRTLCVMPYFVDTGFAWYPVIRFQNLMKMVQPEVAAKRIVDATLRDFQELVIPGYFALSFTMKRLMPLRAKKLIDQFLDLRIEEHIPMDKKSQ